MEIRHLNEHFDRSQLYITFLQVLEKRHFHVQNYRTLKGSLSVKQSVKPKWTIFKTPISACDPTPGTVPSHISDYVQNIYLYYIQWVGYGLEINQKYSHTCMCFKDKDTKFLAFLCSLAKQIREYAYAFWISFFSNQTRYG